MFLASKRRLQKKRHNFKKLSWVLVPMKMFSVARNLSEIKDQHICVAKRITRRKATAAYYNTERLHLSYYGQGGCCVCLLPQLEFSDLALM
jgi:hypothetical protein